MNSFYNNHTRYNLHNVGQVT